MLYKTFYNSPLGEIILISDAGKIVSLNFAGQKNCFCTNNKTVIIDSNQAIFNRTKKWLDCYFKGIEPNFSIPVALTGTDFQKSVWHALCKIKFGQTQSYAGVAQMLNKSNIACRAIGTAISKNPILIIIPCHRVINSNGKLGDYAAGAMRKKKLLELELSNSLPKSIVTF